MKADFVGEILLTEMQLRTSVEAVPSLRGGGGGGVPPLTTACVPPFWFTQITVFGISRNARQQTMMEKGIITFKPDSPLTFSRFFAKLLATNKAT